MLWEDPEANWDKKRIFPRILEHSKIIEAKYFTKIGAHQEILISRALSTYKALNKISLIYQNMVGRYLWANLAILDPMVKLVFHSKMRFKI